MTLLTDIALAGVGLAICWVVVGGGLVAVVVHLAHGWYRTRGQR